MSEKEKNIAGINEEPEESEGWAMEILETVFHGRNPESMNRIQYAFAMFRAEQMAYWHGIKTYWPEFKQRVKQAWHDGGKRGEEWAAKWVLWSEKDESTQFEDMSDLVVISGASGSGKDAIITRLMEQDERLACSISCTTRAPRAGRSGKAEEDGVDYYFMSRTQFDEAINQEQFIEHAEVHGEMYGTRRDEIERLRNGEADLILINADPQGAKQIVDRAFSVTTIFILPPDARELRRRLEERGAETREAIEKRMKDAKQQIEAAFDYDYAVVNDDLEKAVQTVAQILAAVRHDRNHQQVVIEKILDSFNP